MSPAVARRAATSPAIPADVVIRGAYNVELTAEAQKQLAFLVTVIEEANKLADEAGRITVKDQVSNDAAADVVIRLAKNAKQREELRKYFKQPLDRAGKTIDSKFKELSATAAGQEERLRDETGSWFIKQRDEAAKAEQKRLADEEAQRRKARMLGRAAPPPAPAPAPAPAPTTHAAAGSLNIRTKFVLDDVEDLEKVPRQYLMVNPKAVAAAIDAGVKQIPGLRIKEVPISSAR